MKTIFTLVWVLLSAVVAISAEAPQSPLRVAQAFGIFQTSNNGPALFLPATNNISANWANAGLSVIGGIPTRNTVCTTINPSGKIPPTSGDDDSLILAAIAGCTAGQVVMLGTGTWNIAFSQTPVLLNKGITLRGTGSPVGACDATMGTPCWGTVVQVYDGPQPTYQSPSQCGVTISSTTNCPNGSGFFMVAPQGPSNFGWGSTGQNCSAAATSINPTTANCGTTLTADAAQGDTSVVVTSTSNFSVGMWVLIDENPQLVTTTNPIAGQASIQASPEFLNTTNTGVMKLANPDSCSFCTYSFVPNRLNQEIHLITAINTGTKTITFDSPLTLAYRQSGSHDARLYWPTIQSASTPNPFLTQAGIENMTILRANGGVINFEYCAYCWARNIEAAWFIGGIQTEYSVRTQITGTWQHGCIDCQNNGDEYPQSTSAASTEILFNNNIITKAGKGMVGRGANSVVVADNYIDQTMYEATVIGDWFVDMSLNGSHYGGTHHYLFEGNWANNCDGDETHGNAISHTFFRNNCTGICSIFVDPSNGLTVNDCAGIGYSPYGVTISSGTYNSTTGVISLTLSASVGYSAGTKVSLGSLTGTGTNLFNLAGTWNATTATGTTLVLAGPTGQGSITITGGNSVGNLPTTPGPLRAAGPMAFNYWYAYLGNVLGYSGIQSCAVGTFVYNAISGGVIGPRGMWMSGWTGAEWGAHPDPNLDGANNPTFIFRNGNFDYVNVSVVDNAAGYSQSFPNSLYLPSGGASAPSYFSGGASCTYAYPWIVPASGTVRTASGAGACTTYSGLPAKARADAGTYFTQP